MSLRSIAIAMTLPACLLKPSPPSGEGAGDARMADSRTIDGSAGDAGGLDSDAGSGSDGSGSAVIPMWPYLRSVAYYSSVGHTSGTSGSGYEIDATAVRDNDVLLLVGSIDNGVTDGIPLPVGFQRLFDDYYSGGNGQTYFAAWKVAAGEPPDYQGTYSNTSGDQYGAFELISISGANTSSPIDFYRAYLGSGSAETGSLQAQVTGPSDMTAVANETVVVAAGADWLGSSGGSVADLFPGPITLVAKVTDEGENMTLFQRTSLTVGWFEPAPPAGPLGSNALTLSGSDAGVPWGFVIAVEPAP